MSEASFSIVYGGPALRDHSMDVRALAPAVLALGEVFDAANIALNGDAVRIRVQVKATEPGSFQITFEVIQSLGSQLTAFLTGPGVTAAANLVGLVVGGPTVAVGLWQLIKRLRGRPIDSVKPLSRDTVRITVATETVDIPLQLLRLYQDVAVRTATQRVVEEPLKQDGVDSFAAQRDGRAEVEVGKFEAPSFGKPEVPDTVLIDDVRRSAFSIISLAFKEDNKWRLNDGTNPISAAIEDEEFLRKVDANLVSFSKGDILVCDVRVLQKQTAAGLKTEYTVVRVVEHRPAARQLPLPFTEQA